MIVLALVLGWTGVYSQSTPKYSNEFLAIGVNARALGLSSAFVSIPDDVTAGYWNPAGVANLSYKYDLSLMHAEYFAGLAKYDYAAFGTNIDSISGLSISIIRFAVDDIPDTRFLYDANGALNYDNIRFFSAADYAFLFSYARKLKFLGGMNLGGNFKIIHRNVGNFANAWGYGLDLGIKKSYSTWGFGIVARDVTGTFNTWSHNSELLIDIYSQTGNVVPESSIEVTLPRLILGAYKKFDIRNVFSLMTTMDLEATFDGKRNTLITGDPISIDPRIGIEGGYLNKFYIRLGVGQLQKIQDFDGSELLTYQPNFGLGVRLNNVNIDYALTDIGDQSESLYSHVISLTAGFNEKK